MLSNILNLFDAPKVCAWCISRRLLALALAAPAVAFGYEESTHAMLTEKAAARSKVVQRAGFFLASGLRSPSDLVYSGIGSGAPLQVDAVKLMSFGATWEDGFYPAIARNHFFDPQFQNGIGRGLQVAFLREGLASPDWALEDTGVFTDPDSPNVGQVHGFSLRDAGEAFYVALKSPLPGDRLAAQSRMWQTLGHVVHHVQDMAQPQHVRNEPHLHTDILGVTVVVPPKSRSFYELYTQSLNVQLSSFLETHSYTLAPGTIRTARQFFRTPSAPFSRRGMAEFTAENFVTTTTSPALTTGGVPVPSSEFPLPGSADMYFRQMPVLLLKFFPGLHQNYLYGRIVDGVNNAYLGDALLGIESLWFRLGGGYVDDDPAVANDRHKFLLPRAVAFSAGLIDHFFRGSMTLVSASSDGKQWTLTNGGEDLEGILEFYGEQADGQRSLLSQQGFFLGSGVSAALAVPIAPSYARLLAVFKGRIGAEGNSLGRGYYSVAGAIAAVPAAPVASCPGDVLLDNSMGTNSNLDMTFQLVGSGTVQTAMENYSIPDSLTISIANSVVVNTGMFAGEQRPSFEYRSGQSVRVQVQATSSDLWNLRLSCPGQGLQGDAVPKKLVSITVTNPTGAFLCSGAFWDIWIDGSIHLTGSGSSGWFVRLSAGGEPHSVRSSGSCPSIGALNQTAGQLNVNGQPLSNGPFLVR
ncbi:hypothetical protein [Ramlibacter sp. AN1133]|uniref:hypothetical protein n=1 Tax=Ramlibacter sp. AN1133 TaxID=3133429 RepID=UPI0030BF2105